MLNQKIGRIHLESIFYIQAAIKFLQQDEMLALEFFLIVLFLNKLIRIRRLITIQKIFIIIINLAMLPILKVQKTVNQP
jgi:hypothetical protein